MENRLIALKIDVDTYQGMKSGVPTLLAILGKFRISATFFLSFGPDNSGKAIWNVFRSRGFLSKMMRTGAPRLYGLKTLFYGTLLPAPPIASAFPSLVRQIDQEGHEIGVHAWDHRRWQDHLDSLSPRGIQREFERSFHAYTRILNRHPRSTAAPAWRCNQKSLEVQDGLSLDYSSDVRGEDPFYPRLEGKVFQTLQIPSNQPCIEEIIGLNGVTRENLVESQLTRLKKGMPNVLPIHAEVEGGAYQRHFAEFLLTTSSHGYGFLCLSQLCTLAKKRGAPTKDIAYKELPGRSGLVATSF